MAILAVLVTRAIAIFGLGNLSNLVSQVKTDWREQTVLWWGGLRGSVSIALALSVPALLDGRQEIIDIVFGVVLFTLLAQGLSTQWLLETLNLIGDQPLKQEFSELLARRIALKKVITYLEEEDNIVNIDAEYVRYQKGLVTGELKAIEDKISKMRKENDSLRSLSIEQLREQLLDIEADTYAELIRAGQLNENLSPVLQEIMVEADLT